MAFGFRFWFFIEIGPWMGLCQEDAEDEQMEKPGPWVSQFPPKYTFRFRHRIGQNIYLAKENVIGMQVGKAKISFNY